MSEVRSSFQKKTPDAARPKPRFMPEAGIPARIRAEVLTWKDAPASVRTVPCEDGARSAFEAFNDEIFRKMTKADRSRYSIFFFPASIAS